MNKYQEALDKVKTHCLSSPSLQNGAENGFGPDYNMYHDCYEDETQLLQELVDKAPYYKELEDKATPKKPIELTYKLLLDEGWKYECPTCKCVIGINDNASDYMNEDSFCPSCSQAIDWSKNE